MTCTVLFVLIMAVIQYIYRHYSEKRKKKSKCLPFGATIWCFQL